MDGAGCRGLVRFLAAEAAGVRAGLVVVDGVVRREDVVEPCAAAPVAAERRRAVAEVEVDAEGRAFGLEAEEVLLDGRALGRGALVAEDFVDLAAAVDEGLSSARLVLYDLPCHVKVFPAPFSRRALAKAFAKVLMVLFLTFVIYDYRA